MYLGVWLDSQMSWVTHVRKMHEKICKLFPKMIALARNTFGYNSNSRRIMLEGTVTSYMRYACAAYAHRLHVYSVVKYIERAHRSMLLCYGRLCRTVSYIPATVICNWVPLKYYLAAKALTYAKKKAPHCWDLQS